MLHDFQSSPITPGYRTEWLLCLCLLVELVCHGSCQCSDDGTLNSETSVDQVDRQLLSRFSVGQTPSHVAEDSGSQGNAGWHSWIILGFACESKENKKGFRLRAKTFSVFFVLTIFLKFCKFFYLMLSINSKCKKPMRFVELGSISLSVWHPTLIFCALGPTSI